MARHRAWRGVVGHLALYGNRLGHRVRELKRCESICRSMASYVYSALDPAMAGRGSHRAGAG